ncbi:polysaccharide biosynthesis protein [Nocardia vinacea]|uniref:polysaccharide biosynthesis protein n=1 Tax=Nocardia vinacea TaxID=96468 RepID=UPI002E1273B5|nr:polysaccharide biosynthesis protein [Nocardia vinacea]
MGDMAEFARYLNVRRRELSVPGTRLREKLTNRSVLVTGATGCVGSILLEQLSTLNPAALIGVGLDEPVTRQAYVDYVFADVRADSEMDQLFDRFRPDVVFHLAAQRDPGLAEKDVARTVTTNVLGTANIVDKALAFGVTDLVYASTGKAMRPYTRDVYAASKKVAEWVVSRAGVEGGLSVTAARFTHIVDNSIVLEKFRALCRKGSVLPVHDPNATFYVQSAIESAQLLMASLLVGQMHRPAVCAINNLGWPFRVLDIADGVIHEVGNRVAVDIVGEELGYEQGVYPGLFDSKLSGDISPLINVLEARSLLDVGLPEIDAALLQPPSSYIMDSNFETLLKLCADSSSDDLIKKCMDDLLYEMLAATLALTPDHVIKRMVKFSAQPRGSASTQYSHARIDELLHERARDSKSDLVTRR